MPDFMVKPVRFAHLHRRQNFRSGRRECVHGKNPCLLHPCTIRRGHKADKRQFVADTCKFAL